MSTNVNKNEERRKRANSPQRAHRTQRKNGFLGRGTGRDFLAESAKGAEKERD